MREYRRFDGETDEELIYRICSEKEKIGSWKEVGELLNELTGNEFTESAYRKKYQAFQKMLISNQAKFSETSSQLLELQQQTAALKNERIKLQTANIEKNRIDRNQARHELFYEYIGQAIECLPVPKFEPYGENNNGMEYILCLADLHYGATFKSQNNEYSPTVCKDRLEYLCGMTIDFVKKHNVKNIKVLGLGDSIQGILRLSDLKINDSSVVKAIVEISRLISNFLNKLSQYTKVEYYHVPSANHSQMRLLGSKASEMADEDLEYVISNYIKDTLKINNRVSVILSPEGEQFLELNVNGFDIISAHGHTLNGYKNALKNICMLKRKFYDYCILGHFHGGDMTTSYEGVLHDCETIVVPSFIGSDPYSDSLMKGSKGAALILGFDEMYGHTETYKIVLN